MRDLVCLYDLGAELGKHPGDCRLATGDPAGQAHFEQACLSGKSRREHSRRLNLKRERVPARGCHAVIWRLLRYSTSAWQLSNTVKAAKLRRGSRVPELNRI